MARSLAQAPLPPRDPGRGCAGHSQAPSSCLKGRVLYCPSRDGAPGSALPLTRLSLSRGAARRK